MGWEGSRDEWVRAGRNCYALRVDGDAEELKSESCRSSVPSEGESPHNPQAFWPELPSAPGGNTIRAAELGGRQDQEFLEGGWTDNIVVRSQVAHPTQQYWGEGDITKSSPFSY